MDTLLKINKMSFEDMSFAVSSANSEGWNPGLFDADCFYHADPNGFLMAKIDSNKVGCISAVAYNDNYGFIGFYIVAPEYRGKGYGVELGKAALASLGDRNIGLDGGLERQDVHKKYWGFSYAYKNMRFQGKAESKKLPTALPIAGVDFNKLLEYDSQVFLFSRPVFLSCWISRADSFGYYLEHEGTILGYGILRKCFTGYRIGPLFADDEIIAREIVDALLSNIPGELYYLDIPEPNTASLKIVQQYNMQKVFETARMYTKEIPNVPLHKVFGITSFELG